MPRPERHVFVCVNDRPPTHPKGSCVGRGGGDVLRAFAEELDRKALRGRMALTATRCLGPCDQGANVLVYPEGVMYAKVRPEDVESIVDEHLVGGTPVARLVIAPEIWG
jgi:(2Fe-2S) ferredoxin